jgi:hypothetical protein
MRHEAWPERGSIGAGGAQAMHYLDPDSFQGEGPSPEGIQQLGHAFIPCLLNRRVCSSPLSSQPESAAASHAVCRALLVHEALRRARQDPSSKLSSRQPVQKAP